MKKSDVKIYVVDDDRAYRDSLGALLLSRHYAVQSFESGEVFLQHVASGDAGVALLDLRMGTGMTGRDVFDKLQQIGSPIHVIFHSAHGQLSDAVQVMERGAITWLTKSCTEEELLSKVEMAVEKARQVAERLQERSDARAIWRALAPREKRVAPLYAKGKTAQEIADELTRQGPNLVGRRVVEGYILSIRQKLGHSTDNELLIWMIRNRLPPEAPLDQGVL
jgi:two-component system, LuxR family, response regulator TtrR